MGDTGTPRCSTFDVEAVRRRFPGLTREVAGRPAVFLDGPAGSQVPDSVVEAVAHSLAHGNGNTGGLFATSLENEAMQARALQAASDFVGGDDPALITYGPSMTTLVFSLSRALSRTWKAGDEVVVTSLDHDANVSPWVIAARDAGATVRTVGIRAEDCTIDLDDYRAALGPKTRFVAFASAANATGTLNPVREMVELAHRAGALVFIDAVHSAPHLLTDVTAWNCDFLACSPYKFFGPHSGLLWGRRELLESLPVDKLRPSTDELPGRWCWGTNNFEAIAGAMAAIDYIAELGRDAGRPADRRAALRQAYETIGRYERGLTLRFLDGLDALPSIKVWGITDRSQLDRRCPTFALTHATRTPRDVAGYLAERGIFAWHGNFYALSVTEALGLEPEGVVRVGLLHYNTAGEVDRLVAALEELG